MLTKQQMRILNVVSSEMTATEVGKVCNIAFTTTSRTLQELTKLGLVRKIKRRKERLRYKRTAKGDDYIETYKKLLFLLNGK